MSDALRAGLVEKAKREKSRRSSQRNPNGTYGTPPEGAFTNEAGQMVDPAQRDALDERRIASRPIFARAQEAIQGTPFVGEFLDEIVEQVNPRAAQDMRAMSDAMERQRPGQSMALNIVGGVAMSGPYLAGKAAQAGANFIGRGQGLLSRGLRAGAVAAPAGAVEGAASMAGRAAPGGRAEAAGTGAAVGGGLAFALGPVAALVGSGAQNLATRVKKLDVRTIADQFGISPGAARIVKSHLVNDDLDAAAAALARGGPDAMLADAGPATRQSLDTSMSMGGAALSVPRARVNERAQMVGQRLIRTLDNVLGEADGVKSATKKIAQRTAPARKKAYDFAFAQPTPMTGEAGQAIDDVLARIDPRTMREALDEANAEMLDSGARNMNIKAQIADDGTVTFSQPLSVMQLDYLARGLGNVADAGTDKITGAMSPGARRAISQAKALRDTLKDNVSGYRRALKIGGDAIAEREALLMGRKLLTANTSFEDVVSTMRNAPMDVKAAARQGLRQNIDEVMNRARTTLSDIEQGNFDFNTGMDSAREALSAVKALGSRDNFRKARVVLGSDAKQVFDELQKTADALALRAAVARNSATAIRQAGQQQMAAEAQPGLVRRTVGNAGNPFEAMRDVTQAAAGTDAQALSRITQDQAAEISDALTRIRGPEAQRALDVVRRAMAGQPIKDEEAALIGRLVGGSAGVGLYRTGQQLRVQRPQ